MVFLPFLLSICFSVYVFRLVFRVDDLLAAVQPVISRQHIAESNGDHIVWHPFESEQFKRNQKRCNRAVRDAAEHGAHAHRRAQRRGQSNDISKETAESCPDKERGNDLAAFVSGAQCRRREDHFQQKGKGEYISLHALFNNGHSRSVVIPVPHQQSKCNNNASAGDCAKIGIFEKVLIQFFGFMQDNAEYNTHQCA